jgi:hypothetical protein
VNSNVRPTLRLVALVAGLCLCLCARADWADLGASWKCSPKAGTLSVRSVVRTSSGDAVPPQPGFKEIPNSYTARPPYTTRISCALVGAKVTAVIYARAGTYQLSLWVNGKQVFRNELFNSGLGLSPVVYQVEVLSRGKESPPSVVVCRGNWRPEGNYEGGACNEER